MTAVYLLQIQVKRIFPEATKESRMSTTTQLIERICDDSMKPDLLEDLRTAVGEPETADAIVGALLARYGLSSQALEAVASVMERLEVIAESDAELGCCLMAHLWGTASQVEGAFDVTDSIDLWLANTKPVGLEAQVRYLAQRSQNPHLAEHFSSITKM